MTRPILLFFLTLGPLLAAGQITIDQNDMPSAGDTIRRSIGLDIDFTDPEETGEDYSWDYSQLIPIFQQVDTFVTVTQTPIFYWPFFLFSANLASPLVQDSPFPQLPLTDVFGFYDKSSSRYDDVGFAATLFGIPLPFKYDDPDVLYRFPLNYGDVDSSSSGFALGIPDVGYVMVDRKRKNTVDGWGELVTPYGSFEVLRLKSEVTEYDSIYLDTLGIGIPVNREFTEYKWLGKGHGLPLLTVTDNLIGYVIEYVDSVRMENVGIGAENNPDPMRVSVYPNPTNRYLHVDFDKSEDEVLVYIYGLDGKVLYRSTLNPVSGSVIDLDGLNLSRGPHLLHLESRQRNLIRTFIYNP